MNKTKRYVQIVLLMLVFAAGMIIGTKDAKASIICPDCGNEVTAPHSASTDMVYCMDNKDGYHVYGCIDCSIRGHADTCKAFYKKEAHKKSITGKGDSRKEICSACDYEKALPCNHANRVWDKGSLDSHYRICDDCGKKFSEGKHSWTKYKKGSNNGWHDVYCSVCNRACTDNSKAACVGNYNHLKSVVKSTTKTYGYNNVKVHKVTTKLTCKCGAVSTSTTTEDHSYNSAKVCTKCKFKRPAAPAKPVKKKITAKKSKKWKYTANGYWYTSFGKHYWQPARKVTAYKHQLTVTWKPAANANQYRIEVYDGKNYRGGISPTTKTTYTFLDKYGSTKKATMKVVIVPINHTKYGDVEGPALTLTKVVK